MTKSSIFLTLSGLTIGSSFAALVIDSGFSVAYGIAAITAGYALSLCQGGRQITLPTQNLDDACRMMDSESGRWHLVAVPGHCVVAYRSADKAMDAMSADAVGYAVVDCGGAV